MAGKTASFLHVCTQKRMRPTAVIADKTRPVDPVRIAMILTIPPLTLGEADIMSPRIPRGMEINARNTPQSGFPENVA